MTEEVLDKREVLRGLSHLGELLRAKPEIFTYCDGIEDMNATQIRLNSLGKVLNIGAALITSYKDGEELKGDLKEYHRQYTRLLDECFKPYR